MTDEPTHYLCCRSHGDHRLYVICYADRFYEDVPADVRGAVAPGEGNGARS